MPDRLPVVLASGSPRRRELLARILGEHGFHWASTDFDETAAEPCGESPGELVLRLADGKRDHWTAHHAHGPLADCLVLTADTVVVLEGRILGKPVDAEDAGRMLRLLSGRRHDVLTGMSLAWIDKGIPKVVLRHVEDTAVVFAPLPDTRIEWYVGTGEPMDKAGAYGIQGHGALLVERIEGCYYNVMGLPIHRLVTMLEQIEETTGLSGFVSHLSPSRTGREDGRKESPSHGTNPSDHRQPAGKRTSL
jgi:septum formation protein